MSAAVPTVDADTPAAELRRVLARPRVDRLAVSDEEEIVGVVTRRDLLETSDVDASRPADASAPRTVSLEERIPTLGPLLEAIDLLPGEAWRTFLVGGGVRDALLGAEVVDIDIAVEGPGIEFATLLARGLGGEVTTHGDFGTATVTAQDLSVDVATTRSELYAEPGALPMVESAAIESDLFRRDFTMNAMAVELAADRRGRLVDPFGGERDLASGTLRVLHNLSFLDDPTRLLRAARYEARYGFRLDGRSEALARACVELGLLGALSGARVGNELVRLADEPNALTALGRLEELGALEALQPGLEAGEEARASMERAAQLADELGVESPVWRTRLAVLSRSLGSSERYRWLESLQLARRDIDAVADAAALGPALRARVSEPLSAAELSEALRARPIEAVLLALADSSEGSPAQRALRRYLGELRHVELAIGGDELVSLGLPESPAVGRVLAELLSLKLDGAVATREEELEAARRLIVDEQAEP